MTVSCGAAPPPAAPAPTSGDVTVPEPVAKDEGVSSSEAPVSAASAPAPREVLVPALAQSIEDGYETHLIERVKIAHDAEARAHLEDPEVKQAPSMEDPQTMVVATSPSAEVKAARVVVDTKAVRVLLWFDPSQMASVITEVTDLSPTHKPRSRRTAGVTARPGLRVKRGTERGERVQVDATFEFPSPDSALVTTRGWVDKSKVGYVYQPLPASNPPRGERSFVKEATDILTAPGGAVLAKVGKGGGGIFFPVTILGQRGRMREISLAGTEIEVRGFVSETVLEELEPEHARGWGRGRGKASLWQRWPKEQVRIPGGTCIYDAPGGEAIGVFKREHVENVVIPSEGSPHRAYRLPYDAVGHLYAADLVPVKKGEAQAASKQSIDLGAGSWKCPKRPD